MHRLLQFYADTFETLQLLRLWSENVHIVWAYASDFFATFFYKMQLIICVAKVNRYLVSCNASSPTVLC